jgi:mono/diheme cytochrome c family protein
MFLGLSGCAGNSEVGDAPPSGEAEADIVAGRAYAQRACAQCHNVTARRPRLFSGIGAPDFYAIAAERTTSPMGLNVFLLTPHPTMPNFIIADQDRRNVIAYIMSFRPPAKAAPAGT